MVVYGTVLMGTGEPSSLLNIPVAVGSVIYYWHVQLNASVKKQETRWNPLTDELLESLCALLLTLATC